MRQYYKTIVISDLHLGTRGSKAEKAANFLQKYKCDNLILNGDIIDGWRLKSGGKWKTKHTRFVTQVLKMITQDNTSVLYLRGDRDDFLDAIIPLNIKNISISWEHIYESCGKRYYVTHGDMCDPFNLNLRWLSAMGESGHKLLLWINRRYNRARLKHGLSYHTLQRNVKPSRKQVRRAKKYEMRLTKLARSKQCQGVIGGHLHQPEIKEIDGITYMNSGAWFESTSALFEDHEGQWHIGWYSESSFETHVEDEQTSGETNTQISDLSSGLTDELNGHRYSAFVDTRWKL